MIRIYGFITNKLINLFIYFERGHGRLENVKGLLVFLICWVNFQYGGARNKF